MGKDRSEVRDDLNKLICERERRGAYRKHHEWRRQISGKKREGMAWRYGWDARSFNENLNPLFKWIDKQVGRPWARVYSELCQQFDKRSVINQHVLGHLWDHVERNVMAYEGALWIGPRRFGAGAKMLKHSSVELYIDPRDGLLKNNNGAARARARREEALQARTAAERLTHRALTPTTAAKRLDADSPWYICTLADFPEPVDVPYVQEYFGRRVTRWRREDVPVWDAFLKQIVRANHGAGKQYVVSRRVANKKEIRNYGLNKP